MALRQLYYTSCEHGLSGYPGYQFNAVSDGISPEVMRDVERLTAYEPPAGLGFAPTQAQIDACPASLCWSPGATAILANVVFLGADFSHRFGNYFVHALVTDDPEHDLGGRLPIEAWGAPCWTHTPATSTVLPALLGPVPGGAIDRARVDAQLAGDASAGYLPRLLTAVLGAVAGDGRPVVLVGHSAEHCAAWIAAVSYLLPEPLVRRMSFTTYHRRPRHCGLHVAATMPGDAALREAPDGLAVFDLVAGWSNADEAHPVATRLASLGARAAEGLWAEVQALGCAPSALPDDLEPGLGAALARRGMALSPSELGAAVTWFAAAARDLPAGLVAELGGALVAQPETDEHELRAVVRAAAATGVAVRSERLERLEWQLVDAELRRLTPDGLGGGTAITSGAVRSRAACALRERLVAASEREALALLAWAVARGVPIEPVDQEASGARLAGAALAGDLRAAELARVATTLPGTLVGVVDRLELAAAGDPDRVLELLGDGLERLLTEERRPARLGELCAVLQARRDRSGPATLQRLVGGRRERGDQGAFDDLLHQLWWTGEWSHADAAEVVALIPAEVLTGELPAWLDRVVARGPRPGSRSEREAYLHLCDLLGEVSPLPLEMATRATIAEVGRTREYLRQAAERDGRGTQALIDLVTGFGRLPGPLRELLLEKVPALMLGLDAAGLASVLDCCPRPVLEAWLDAARSRLRPARPDPDLGARAFLAATRLRPQDPAWRHRLEFELLVLNLPVWRGRYRREVARHLAASGDPGAAEAFLRWREHYDRRPTHRLGRAVHRWLGRALRSRRGGG